MSVLAKDCGDTGTGQAGEKVEGEAEVSHPGVCPTPWPVILKVIFKRKNLYPPGRWRWHFLSVRRAVFPFSSSHHAYVIIPGGNLTVALVLWSFSFLSLKIFSPLHGLAWRFPTFLSSCCLFPAVSNLLAPSDASVLYCIFCLCFHLEF